MFGWIDSVWNNVVGAIPGPIRDFVHILIRGLYSFVHGVFGAVWNAWNVFWNGARDLWAGAREFAGGVYHGFIRIFKILIPYLEAYIKWVRTILDKALSAAVHVLSDAIQTLYHTVLKLLDALRKWAVDNIWNPLFKSLTAAWHWLTHEGAMIWYYFTHLPAFAKLLLGYLLTEFEKQAWDAGKALGRFFLSLVVHNAVRFASLMEDIISAILE